MHMNPSWHCPSPCTVDSWSWAALLYTDLSWHIDSKHSTNQLSVDGRHGSGETACLQCFQCVALTTVRVAVVLVWSSSGTKQT